MIQSFPCFAPEEVIVTSVFSERKTIKSTWRALCGLKSLKGLGFDYLSSKWLVRSGLPPNLEELYIHRLGFEVKDEADFAALAGLPGSFQSPIRFNAIHSSPWYLDQRNTKRRHRRRYLAELALWSQLDGFKCEKSVAELEEAWGLERGDD